MSQEKIILIVEHAPRRANGLIRHLQAVSEPTTNNVLWRCYQNDELPPAHFDALVLSGGPMMVDELKIGQHTFFSMERRLIEFAEKHDIPTLGVCLGAQILADHFGGSVEQRTWEIGWCAMRTTEAAQHDEVFRGISSFATFELHRDQIIQLPPSAIRLAISDKSENEAFRVDAGTRIWGCIFHPEIDPDEAQKIYDVDSRLFLNAGVQREQLAPLNDGLEMRRHLFANFAQLVQHS